MVRPNNRTTAKVAAAAPPLPLQPTTTNIAVAVAVQAPFEVGSNWDT
jgi:hypothetical protein